MGCHLGVFFTLTNFLLPLLLKRNVRSKHIADISSTCFVEGSMKSWRNASIIASSGTCKKSVRGPGLELRKELPASRELMIVCRKTAVSIKKGSTHWTQITDWKGLFSPVWHMVGIKVYHMVRIKVYHMVRNKQYKPLEKFLTTIRNYPPCIWITNSVQLSVLSKMALGIVECSPPHKSFGQYHFDLLFCPAFCREPLQKEDHCLHHTLCYNQNSTSILNINPFMGAVRQHESNL